LKLTVYPANRVNLVVRCYIFFLNQKKTLGDMFEVHLTYLGESGEELLDRTDSFFTDSVPRIGELIFPQAGENLIVHQVAHKAFVRHDGVQVLVQNILVRPHRPNDIHHHAD
jgi:hypothetical protein